MSVRFDEAEDERLVSAALRRAVAAGVSAEAIDRVLISTAHEPADAFRAPVTAGRLHALARAQPGNVRQRA